MDAFLHGFLAGNRYDEMRWKKRGKMKAGIFICLLYSCGSVILTDLATCLHLLHPIDSKPFSKSYYHTEYVGEFSKLRGLFRMRLQQAHSNSIRYYQYYYYKFKLHEK